MTPNDILLLTTALKKQADGGGVVFAGILDLLVSSNHSCGIFIPTSLLGHMFGCFTIP